MIKSSFSFLGHIPKTSMWEAFQKICGWTQGKHSELVTQSVCWSPPVCQPEILLMSHSENPPALWRHSSRQQVHPACSCAKIRSGGSKTMASAVNGKQLIPPCMGWREKLSSLVSKGLN